MLDSKGLEPFITLMIIVSQIVLRGIEVVLQGRVLPYLAQHLFGTPGGAENQHIRCLVTVDMDVSRVTLVGRLAAAIAARYEGEDEYRRT